MEIILASNNKGKIKEFNHLFKSYNITVIPQSDYNVPEIEETGLSFIENAILKARNASFHTKKPAIADDSGLVVPFLKGAPGIYSARYSEEQTDDANNRLLLQNLLHAKNEERNAFFISLIAFVRHDKDPIPLCAEGTIHGSILHELKGHEGFGYDPLFWIPSLQKSMAEISLEEKNEISHRAVALRSFKKEIETDPLFNR